MAKSKNSINHTKISIYLYILHHFDELWLLLPLPALSLLFTHTPQIFLFAVTIFHFFTPSTPSPKFCSVLLLTLPTFFTYFSYILCLYWYKYIERWLFKNNTLHRLTRRLLNQYILFPALLDMLKSPLLLNLKKHPIFFLVCLFV